MRPAGVRQGKPRVARDDLRVGAISSRAASGTDGRLSTVLAARESAAFPGYAPVPPAQASGGRPREACTVDTERNAGEFRQDRRTGGRADDPGAPSGGHPMPRSPRSHPITAALHTLCLAALAGALLPAAHAQTPPFPVKSVRLVHTFPAGGPVDFVTRGIAEELTRLWGQSVVVDPRPGGGGSIGSEIVRAAPPDGYTLLTGTHSGMVASPLLNPAVKYHPLKDFTPITQMVNSPFFLITNAQVPATSLKDLLALLRAQPGKLNYGSVGQGSSTHLAFEMFAHTAGVNALHVPYKGTAPMIVDLLSGTLQMTITSIPTVLPHVKSGKLRAVANGSLRRSTALPDTPTFNEAGMPGFESVTWYGLFAPARLPRAQLKEMNATAVKALASPALLARYGEAGLETVASTPEAFSRFIGEEMDRWSKLIRQAGIKVSE